MGLGQGALNIANGLQDAGAGIVNVGAYVSPLAWGIYLGTGAWVDVPSPDWSEGMLTAETEFLHDASKFVGAEGVITLATMGIGQISHVNDVGTAARIVDNVDDVATTMARARALGQEGEAAAQIVKNIQRIDSLTSTAKYRVPDELTAT